MNYHAINPQIFHDFAYIDKEVLLEIITQIEDPNDITSTLESLFPKPDGWTPQSVTNRTQAQPQPNLSMNAISDLLTQVMTQITQISQLNQDIEEKDKKLIIKIIESKCRNINCYNCKNGDDFFKLAISKYGDEYKTLFYKLVTKLFRGKVYFTMRNILDISINTFVLIKTEEYKIMTQKYGEHISNHTLCYINSKLQMLILDTMNHLVPAIIELLREGHVNVEYALSLNVPEYELDEFMPVEQRKGMSGELIEQFKTKVKILEKDTLTDKCSICLDHLNDPNNESQVVELLCKHEFHWTCIEEQLKVNASCPNCKHCLKEN